MKMASMMITNSIQSCFFIVLLCVKVVNMCIYACVILCKVLSLRCLRKTFNRTFMELKSKYPFR